MKIYINGRFLAEPITGVGRYSLEIIKAIDKILDSGTEPYSVILIVPCRCMLKLKNIQIVYAAIDSNVGEQILLPIMCRDGYLINLSGRAPLLKRKQLLVIHDAHIKMFPAMYSALYRLFWSCLYMIFGRSLKNIVTISSFSKQVIQKYFYIPEDKIKIISEGYEHVLSVEEDESILSRYCIKPHEYILLVGGARNKNFELVMETIRMGGIQDNIVIAGNIDSSFREELGEFSQVKLLGYVSDNELVSLYKNAKCFVFPSIVEGFGIPPLEAMAYNCLSIVSNTTSLPEVCGDAALYCNPYDSDSLKAVLDAVNKDYHNIMHDMVPKMKNNLKKYSWKSAAKNILEIVSCDTGIK